MVIAKLTESAAGEPEVAAPSDESEVSKWECGLASTRREREAAFGLIYQAYVRAGLASANVHGKRVTPYQLLPTTTIFNAHLTHGPEAGLVFSTVSLIGDGEMGLPLERVYPQLVAERRNAGIRLAEVSCLADRRHDFRRFFSVFCALNRWMIQFARAQRIDQVLVAVHPKHARFYTRNMGFEIVGDVTQYPTVGNRPAVALCFDFARNDRSPFPYYDHFFGTPIPGHLLHPSVPTAEELAMYRQWIDPAFSDHNLSYLQSAAG